MTCNYEYFRELNIDSEIKFIQLEKNLWIFNEDRSNLFSIQDSDDLDEERWNYEM